MNKRFTFIGQNTRSFCAQLPDENFGSLPKAREQALGGDDEPKLGF